LHGAIVGGLFEWLGTASHARSTEICTAGFQ
jgi:hypothetical protein